MTEHTPTVHNDFLGYGGYRPEVGEKIIRERLITLFDTIIEKNRLCLERAREMKMEKIMSRVLVVKKRAESIRNMMVRSEEHAHYKIEKMTDKDETAMRKMDREIEDLITDCGDVIGDLTCMETDLHIVDRFRQMNDRLRRIESLCRKRTRLFKKMRVYG